MESIKLPLKLKSCWKAASESRRSQARSYGHVRRSRYFWTVKNHIKTMHLETIQSPLFTHLNSHLQAGIYMFKFNIETPEQCVKHVQS